MRQMLACPKCKGIYSAEEGFSLECSECKIPLKTLGISKEKWSALTSDQKHALREEALKNADGEETAAQYTSRSEPINSIEAMQSDIRTIKNILIFYLVTTILGAIIIAAKLF